MGEVVSRQLHSTTGGLPQSLTPTACRPNPGTTFLDITPRSRRGGGRGRPSVRDRGGRLRVATATCRAARSGPSGRTRTGRSACCRGCWWRCRLRRRVGVVSVEHEPIVRRSAQQGVRRIDEAVGMPSRKVRVRWGCVWCRAARCASGGVANRGLDVHQAETDPQVAARHRDDPVGCGSAPPVAVVDVQVAVQHCRPSRQSNILRFGTCHRPCRMGDPAARRSRSPPHPAAPCTPPHPAVPRRGTSVVHGRHPAAGATPATPRAAPPGDGARSPRPRPPARRWCR